MAKPTWAALEAEIKQADDDASSFVKLKDDGDKVVGTPVGEPVSRRVYWTGSQYETYDENAPDAAKPVLKIAINFATRTDNGWAMKVLENGTRFYKDLMRVDAKYGLDAWAIEIERHGAAGHPKTSYSILPEVQLTEEDKSAIAALEQIDLTTLYADQAGGKREFGDYDK